MEPTNLILVGQLFVLYKTFFKGVWFVEPNVEELVVFDKKSSTLAKVSYPNRQLIAREIEMEKMRRLEAHTVGAFTGNAKSSEKVRKEDKTSDAQPALPNHLQTLKFKELKSNLKAPKVSFSFCVIMWWLTAV